MIAGDDLSTAWSRATERARDRTRDPNALPEVSEIMHHACLLTGEIVVREEMIDALKAAGLHAIDL